ncbi:MAG: hypothetical protein ACK5MZ_05770 [Aestuariibaculum sp.]
MCVAVDEDRNCIEVIENIIPEAIPINSVNNSVIFIDVSKTPKIKDIKKELKCFDTIKPAKLTIYVEQAIENSREITARLGHVFIGIEQNGIIRNLGFYPDNGGAINLISNQDSEIHDNSTSPYHVSISKNISASQLSNIITYIENYPSTYDVRNYNCTDFGIEIAAIRRDNTSKNYRNTLSIWIPSF